jgi:hypothetical protein
LEILSLNSGIDLFSSSEIVKKKNANIVKWYGTKTFSEIKGINNNVTTKLNL